jgi:hypothetical protein
VITDAVLSVLLGGMTALLSLLPSFGVPAGFGSTAYDGFISVGYRVWPVFPIGTLLLVVTALLAAELALHIWDFAVWIYHQVWGGD